MPSRAPDADVLVAAVAQARSTPEALAELRALYADADAEIAAMGQTCRACGTCCDFDRYGHRLYVTTLELALLTCFPVDRADALADGRCPYQEGTICAARPRRAPGCRVFSCDPAAHAAERDLYGRYHRRVSEIHARFGLTYLYVDLVDSLRQLWSSPDV